MSRQVQRPGSRGAHFYYNSHGHVEYGDPPILGKHSGVGRRVVIGGKFYQVLGTHPTTGHEVVAPELNQGERSPADKSVKTWTAGGKLVDYHDPGKHHPVAAAAHYVDYDGHHRYTSPEGMTEHPEHGKHRVVRVHGERTHVTNHGVLKNGSQVVRGHDGTLYHKATPHHRDRDAEGHVVPLDEGIIDRTNGKRVEDKDKHFYLGDSGERVYGHPAGISYSSRPDLVQVHDIDRDEDREMRELGEHGDLGVFYTPDGQEYIATSAHSHSVEPLTARHIRRLTKGPDPIVAPEQVWYEHGLTGERVVGTPKHVVLRKAGGDECLPRYAPVLNRGTGRSELRRVGVVGTFQDTTRAPLYARMEPGTETDGQLLVEAGRYLVAYHGE